jgi:hypothetical protein
MGSAADLLKRADDPHLALEQMEVVPLEPDQLPPRAAEVHGAVDKSAERRLDHVGEPLDLLGSQVALLLVRYARQRDVATRRFGNEARFDRLTQDPVEEAVALPDGRGREPAVMQFSDPRLHPQLGDAHKWKLAERGDNVVAHVALIARSRRRSQVQPGLRALCRPLVNWTLPERGST